MKYEKWKLKIKKNRVEHTSGNMDLVKEMMKGRKLETLQRHS